jgi:hypothetical protein
VIIVFHDFEFANFGSFVYNTRIGTAMQPVQKENVFLCTNYGCFGIFCTLSFFYGGRALHILCASDLITGFGRLFVARFRVGSEHADDMGYATRYVNEYTVPCSHVLHHVHIKTQYDIILTNPFHQLDTFFFVAQG